MADMISSHEYARMLDKTKKPTAKEIEAYIGAESVQKLNAFERFLNRHYTLTKNLKFPFGNNYGWGYKYSHKAKHLCYLFFESGAFTVTVQIGDKLLPSIEKILPSLLPKTNGLWENRYPCGERGGWIHYRVLSDAELSDIYELIKIKSKPSAEN